MSCEKVSIIVPVYNVEKYLKKSLNSLLKQSYANLEIIIVDDGSSDATSSICEKFVKFYRGRGDFPDIKVLYKQHAGVSEARNAGLDLSTGDWIIFVDGDDWIPKDSVQLLVNAAKSVNAEYVVGAFRYIMPGRDFRDQMAELCFSPVNTDGANCADALFFFESLKYYSYNCKKIFKADIIRKNNIRFNPDMKVSEDTAFILQYLMYCTTVRSINKVVYYYNNLRDNGSASKYYQNRSIWADQCLGLYGQVICRYIDSNIERERLLSNYAALRISRDVKEHVSEYNDNTDIFLQCQKTFSLLSKYINESALDVKKSETIQYYKLMKAIQEQRFDSFCLEYGKKEQNSNSRYGRESIRKAICKLKTIYYYGK